MKKIIFTSVCLFLILNLFFVFLSSRISAQELWTPTSTGVNVPHTRFEHTAVWTGSKMIIWGGAIGLFSYINTGGVYDPATDTWTVTSTANAPSPRSEHVAVWTGSKMIVWGGTSNTSTGGLYDPVTDTWSTVSTTNAPAGVARCTAVWTGTKMIIWGGFNNTTHSQNTGGIYDPVQNSWTPTSTVNAPSPRYFHNAVWTGSKMIVWGGRDSTGDFNTGGVYDPVANTWTSTSTTNAPSARQEGTMVWTGDKMIVWAGFSGSAYQNTGGVYNPATDTWTSTSVTNAPTARSDFSFGIWTGSNMIVWGGYNGSGSGVAFNTGGIYNPAANTWTATLITGTPTPRNLHSVILAGNKIIIWGGCDVNITPFNSGGIYTNPAVIGIEKISETVPSGFSLSQNYPNPFNPNSKIKFQIAKVSNARLIVLDALGREISTLVNEQLKPGTYEIDFDGSKYSSGVYFYKLTAGDFIETKKMLMVK